MIQDSIVDGFQNAPHRSLYHALGLTAEELLTRYLTVLYAQEKSYVRTAERAGLDRRTVRARLTRQA